MAAGYATRRDGSFVVELHTPLSYQQQTIDTIVVAAPRYEHTIRWGRGEIPSGLALAAELTGLPERLLRQITYPDVDRVTFALFSQANFAQKDVMDGIRPFATPDELLPPPADTGGLVDQQDPRFPHVEGQVKRFATPPVTQVPPHLRPQAPQEAPQPTEDLDLGLAAPETMKAMTG